MEREVETNRRQREDPGDRQYHLPPSQGERASSLETEGGTLEIEWRKRYLPLLRREGNNDDDCKR